ncbi:MAG: Dabb family protein [Planctomycetota bacterium]|nr:MAG: Dabb family protein [Planctomycetota bacterium]
MAKLAHSVFFSLADSSPESIERQVAACQKYLSGHDGTVFFAVGTRTPDLTREVNVTDYHVALHVVFADRAAHDRYQTHPRHLEFIAENKAFWSQVRVFDADLA